MVERFRTHRLTALYEACHSRGLAVSSDEILDISELVPLIDDANEFGEFRYFKDMTMIAHVSWTLRTTRDLINAVAKYVEEYSTDHPAPLRVQNRVFKIGKPFSKDC